LSIFSPFLNAIWSFPTQNTSSIRWA
jgi:hypothetical protein